MEFKKRYKSARPVASGSNRLPGNYAGKSLDKQAELVLCVDGKGECVGCAGVEVEKVKKMDGYDGAVTAPLMSNLAISRSYRRKGLAEDLVKSAENIARREWGYDECYLYVEKRNVPAIKLYKKLGYKTIWEDDTATLLPTKDGRVANGKTTIVCMKKKLGGGLFGMFGI
jgi:ribosomal protein S18 acetylase RimI-like enzyme